MGSCLWNFNINPAARRHIMWKNNVQVRTVYEYHKFKKTQNLKNWNCQLESWELDIYQTCENACSNDPK